MKILLVEDDETLVTVLTRSLTAHHYIVDAVRDGEAGWTYGSTFEYDLIVLDILLPKLNGIRLCQRFRAEGYTTPILMLTAQNSSTTKVKGLDAGADDYVVKPFDGAELAARIRALLRRGKSTPLPVLSLGALHLNPSSCEVTYGGQPCSLTTKEYDLLELLLRDRHHVFSADEILDRLWSSEEFPVEATVRSHIRRLRQKLATVGAPPDLISTLHGRGYYLNPTIDMPPPRSLAAAPQSTTVTCEQQVQYQAFLNQIWQTTQPQCLDRLRVLQQAIAAIEHGQACPEQQQQAQQIAHQLAGTLGVFGLIDTVQGLRQIEAWLNQIPPSTQAAVEMAAVVHSIQRQVQHPLPLERSAAPSGSDRIDNTARVMIVDTDQAWLQTLAAWLRPWDFEVTTLADPQQFWTQLSTVCPDLLVLEVNLPQISGFQLCQELRSDPHWQQLPVVFLSELKDANIQHHAFAIGADDFLCKPVSGAELANRILNRLQRVRAWRSDPRNFPISSSAARENGHLPVGVTQAFQ